MPNESPNSPRNVYRWRHPGLEELLARPAARRVDLHGFLSDTDRVVAANAAIGLARTGDSAGVEPLATAVRSPDLRLSLRCAAAEALGCLPANTSLRLLGELTDEYGTVQPGASSYNADLHAELVRGLARHEDAADDPRLLTALRSPSVEVRVEALHAWAAGRRGILPLDVADLRTSSEPRLRAAALQALAARRHPEVRQYLSDALKDSDFQVRATAIAALGELGDGQSRAVLTELLKDPSDRIRAEAVATLARLGASSVVHHAAEDPSWRVRLRVAESLAATPDRAAAAVAIGLLDDPSAEVQQKVLTAMPQWPTERAGPVLLVAMAKPAFLTRKLAAQQLASRWKAAAEFPVEGPPARRSEVLAQLQAQFQQEFPPADSVAFRSAKVADMTGNAASTEDRSFCGAIGDTAALDQLASKDLAERRRAAQELATLAKKGPLGSLAIERLYTLVTPEADAAVWQSALEAIAVEADEPAVRLAYTGLGHDTPEVRRRACGYLAAHPSPAHAKMLAPLVSDPNHAVVVAAVRALGVCGKPAAGFDLQPVRQLLASSNEETQLEAAAALVRLGDPAGPGGLERLAYSNDPQIRARAAQTMGELGDKPFAATLVRLLDDRRNGVVRAALAALPKVAGRDMAQDADGRPAGTDEQIRRWKQWVQGVDGLGNPSSRALNSAQKLPNWQ